MIRIMASNSSSANSHMISTDHGVTCRSHEEFEKEEKKRKCYLHFIVIIEVFHKI